MRLTYLLRVSNVGSSAARLLRACYQIPGVPPKLILVSAPPGFVRGGGGLVCRRFASLPARGTLIFKFRIQVPASARGGVIVSNGYARASGMVSFISPRRRSRSAWRVHAPDRRRAETRVSSVTSRLGEAHVVPALGRRGPERLSAHEPSLELTPARQTRRRAALKAALEEQRVVDVLSESASRCTSEPRRSRHPAS